MHAHLLALELERIPRNLGDLQNQYVRLLKHYHPDKNGERKQWAHEKTTRLIQSYRSLRDYIIHRAPGNAPSPAPKTSAPSVAAHRAPRKPANENGFYEAPAATIEYTNFQLINGEDTNYALPLDAIETIASTRLSRFHRHSTGCYCTHGDRILSVVPLRNGTAGLEEIDYVVVMRGHKGDFGIGIPASLKFGTIERVALRELVSMSKRGKGARWLRHEGLTYLVPEIVEVPGSP